MFYSTEIQIRFSSNFVKFFEKPTPEYQINVNFDWFPSPLQLIPTPLAPFAYN